MYGRMDAKRGMVKIGPWAYIRGARVKTDSDAAAEWRAENNVFPIADDKGANCSCADGETVQATGWELVDGTYKRIYTAVENNVSSKTGDEKDSLLSRIAKTLGFSCLALLASVATADTARLGSLTSNDDVVTKETDPIAGAIVSSWEGFLDGSNVVFSITNYISGSYLLDAAKLRILELKEGEYREVYNSRDEVLRHIDAFVRTDFVTATNAIYEAKADRAWGKYTSMGGEAPSNTVYMTHPHTVFAGGLEYERVAVGEGSIAVLTTAGAPVYTAGDEGTFKFQDDGGTNYFGFAKTDSYTVGANTDGITVQGSLVTLTYDITMSGVPCVWYREKLHEGNWEMLNTSDGVPVAGASHSVTWEENPPAGKQIAYLNCPEPSGFFRASVEVAGSAKFMTNMPADFEAGIICPNTATGKSGVIRPTFNGSTVTWTWSEK